MRRPRPPQKTPAERGEEFATEQRRLKREAAERRAAAQAGKKRPEAVPDGQADE
jgi:hypothetical protein